MPSKGPINPVSDGNHYLYVLVDQFSNYFVTVPTPKNDAHYEVNALFHHWISKPGLLQYLITDRGTEFFDSEIANCCSLFNFRQSQRNCTCSLDKWTC